MSPELRRKAEDIFKSLVDLPPMQRAALLPEHCNHEAQLIEQVRELFEACDAGLESFLRTPVQADVEAFPIESRTPRRIGPYTIVRKIGEGGMGVVYEARQEHPRRTVALKVMRPGMATREMLRRFEQEADLLGQLQHPGIAHIYEAGVAEVVWNEEDDRGGEQRDLDATSLRHAPSPARHTLRQPYFAMEFVRGQPLHVYAAQHALDTSQRLELLASICDAVQHAHLKGVIHRDLKPANILVMNEADDRGDESTRASNRKPAAEAVRLPGGSSAHREAPAPKILDFGIARILDADMQTVTLQTDVGQLLGTVPYMSPEQVRGDSRNLDPRSDIYSLGVIMYELFAGSLPLDVRNRAIPEAARIICEEDPSRLGARDTRYRGDIETIVAKALEKDRDKRYQFAAELAADIRRHLHHEPIVARPASTYYQIRKFARRNPGVVFAIGALTLGLSASLWQWAVAVGARAAEHRQRELADESSRDARRERDAARLQAYLGSIPAASAALRDHDIPAAAQHLDLAPADLRGWEWSYLRAQLDDSLVAIPSATSSGTFAPAPERGQLLCLDRLDKPGVEPARYAVSLFDVYTGQKRAVREIVSQTRVRLSQGGQAIGYAPPDGPGRIEETLSGKLLASIRLPEAAQEVLDNAHLLADDGRCVLFGRERCLWCFNTTDSAPHQLSKKRLAAPLNLALSRDGSLAAGTSDNTNVLVWNTSSGEVRASFRRATQVSGLTFSPDNRLLIAGGYDGKLCQWSLDNPTAQPAEFQAMQTRIMSVECSPSGNLLAFSGADHVIRTWNATSHELLMECVGHRDLIRDLEFSPDETMLAASAEDGMLRTWDISPRPDPRVLRAHTSYVYPIVLSPDGRRFYSGGWDGRICCWDSESLELITTIIPTFKGERVINDLAVSPDGNWIAVAHSHGPLEIIAAATGRSRGEFVQTLNAQRVAFGPDGRVYAALPVGLRVWQVSDMQELPALPGEALVAVSPDGRLLATRERNKNIMLIDLSTTQPVAQFTVDTVQVNRVAFSPDGFLCATVDDNKHVCIFSAHDGRRLAVLTNHTDNVYAVAFSPDGRRLATGSADRTIRLWDTATWEETAQLRGHESYIWSLAWSADGRRIISGSGDFTVRIWETEPLAARLRSRHERQKLLAELTPHVRSLLANTPSLDSAFENLRTDPQYSLRQREVALQAALTESVGEGRE